MNRFHRWYCGSSRWGRHLQQDVLPQLMDGVDLGTDVLEVGPGRGRSTEWLRTTYPAMTLLELDPALADALDERFRDEPLTVRRGSATAMPFEDGTFTGIVAATMLHHVPTPAEQDRVFAEASRVLRPGGVFCASDSLPTVLLRLAHLGDTYTPVPPDSLSARMSAAGFAHAEVDIADSFFTVTATR
ncbi:MAG TPA: class I SAM-dependent methyltransferase [Nocardioidaceae bacterium]|nr:class I SAM-dependent methyltransferase [Nocardioidaceae bacterium]